MKSTRILRVLFAFAVLCLVPVASVRAEHHGGGHVHFGVVIGAPFGPGYYEPYYEPYGYYPPSYYYPPPYYPPVIVHEVAPPVYAEQAQPAPTSPSNVWYYCAASKAYYPYVKECRSGWQNVAPTPPPPK